MSGYNEYRYKHEETTTASDECEDETKKSCASEPSCFSGLGGGNAGVWVAALILIILLGIGCWGGFSVMSKGNSKSKDGCSSGFSGLGVGLFFILIVIIFLVAVFYCGWGAIVGFLIFILIIILIGWWASSCWC